MIDEVGGPGSTGMRLPWQVREHLKAQAEKQAPEGDEAPAPPPPSIEDELDGLSKEALLGLAEQLNVRGVSPKTKNSDIVDAIRAKQSEG